MHLQVGCQNQVRFARSAGAHDSNVSHHDPELNLSGNIFLQVTPTFVFSQFNLILGLMNVVQRFESVLGICAREGPVHPEHSDGEEEATYRQKRAQPEAPSGFDPQDEGQNLSHGRRCRAQGNQPSFIL